MYLKVSTSNIFYYIQNKFNFQLWVHKVLYIYQFKPCYESDSFILYCFYLIIIILYLLHTGGISDTFNLFRQINRILATELNLIVKY